MPPSLDIACIMPELPEVETVARDLRDAGLVGRTITDANVYWPRIIDRPSAQIFESRIVGQQFEAVGRRAKYLVFTLSDETLLVHLRMTGQIAFEDPTIPRRKHEHVILELDNERHLRFHDTRKFGRWYLVTEPSDVLGKLGPEPLTDLDAGTFTDLVHGRRRQLKPLLLDQTFIAGLGNIYVDEALWTARIHPLRRSHTLDDDEARRLFDAIQLVLRRGIDNLGTTLGTGRTNFYSVSGQRGENAEELRVFRQTGEPCPRCGTPVERIIVGQRSTHICPRCQSHI